MSKRDRERVEGGQQAFACLCFTRAWVCVTRERERESNPDLGVSNLNLASCECMLNQKINCSSHRYKLNLREKARMLAARY